MSTKEIDSNFAAPQKIPIFQYFSISLKTKKAAESQKMFFQERNFATSFATFCSIFQILNLSSQTCTSNTIFKVIEIFSCLFCFSFVCLGYMLWFCFFFSTFLVISTTNCPFTFLVRTAVEFGQKFGMRRVLIGQILSRQLYSFNQIMVPKSFVHLKIFLKTIQKLNNITFWVQICSLIKL